MTTPAPRAAGRVGLRDTDRRRGDRASNNGSNSLGGELRVSFMYLMFKLLVQRCFQHVHQVLYPVSELLQTAR